MKDFFGTTPYSSFAGNRLGVEQKFFSRKPSRDKNYFSFELVYAGVHYDSQGSFGYKPPGTDSVLYFYSDSIHVYRKTAAFNFKLGRQFFIKHIVVDVAIGVGLKYKHVAHTNRIVPSDLLEPPRHPNAYYEADREGSFFTGNIPIAFKIGYSF